MKNNMENIKKSRRKLQISICISLILTIITSIIDLLVNYGRSEPTQIDHYALFIALVLLLVPLTVIIIPQKNMIYVISALQILGYIWLTIAFDALAPSFIPWIINIFVIIYANDFIRLTNQGNTDS
ncbi:MAG: hypothetical protein ACYDAO_07580 [Thermoplasmataceae archaeon]